MTGATSTLDEIRAIHPAGDLTWLKAALDNEAARCAALMAQPNVQVSTVATSAQQRRAAKRLAAALAPSVQGGLF